jgi:hypothetical protein
VISPELLEDIEVVAEDTGETESPFVRVRRLRLRHRYTDGQYSAAQAFYIPAEEQSSEGEPR